MAKKKSKEVVVVGSKVKEAIKGNGCNTGGDVLEALNGQVHALIDAASARASANGRKTVRGYDF